VRFDLFNFCVSLLFFLFRGRASSSTAAASKNAALTGVSSTEKNTTAQVYCICLIDAKRFE
jgi:hypothetical protein